MKKKQLLHLVTKLPEKYNSKFVEFSQQNLIEYQHTYVCLVSGDNANEDRELYDADIINLDTLGRRQKMITLYQLFLSPKYDLIVFHGLFYTGAFLTFLALLFKFTHLAQKSLWMTWGGDIYYFQNRPNTTGGYINERLRKSIIKKLFFISSLIPDELELIKVNYQSKAVNLSAFYPNPTPYDDDQNNYFATDATAERFTFLLGNSADPQNNHLEMLHALGHLKSSIKVYCVLSYAIVDKAYVERVKSLGQELFGDNFTAISNFMAPIEYRKFIATIDFACYYHNRQQAMGNVFQFLYMGKTVFLREDTLSCLFLQDHGLTVQNTDELNNLTIEHLSRLKKSSQQNVKTSRRIVDNNFSEPAATVKWQNMLKRIFALIKK
ncbi:MAG: dTDP-N-acetylfucosamine:lipid II N-acetylfucosaminyltransferase [Alteromonadaceae bacterium]|jgi:dTDP-N-acetylfucosamine:lipid II N-acetylfucosaminyltransferase